MGVAVAVPELVARWARLYDDHKSVSDTVTYFHFVGIFVGGGFAIVADWAALRLAPADGPEWPRAELARLARVHAWVLAGLGLTLVSGVLMMLADLHTYLTSVVFWTKMGLIALLVANGYGKLRAEAALQQGAPAWGWFRGTAAASLVLWLATLLAGTILTSAS